MDLEKLLKKLEQEEHAMKETRKTKLKPTNLKPTEETPFKDVDFNDTDNAECAEMMTVFAYGIHLCGFDKQEIEKPTTAFSLFLSLWSNKKAREKILEMKKEQVDIAKLLMGLAN